jgi:ATP-dependent Lon protease
MQPKKAAQHKELKPADLKWTCSYKFFKFETTDEIEEATEIVGQTQALNALKLGVELHAQGYNIFITGLSGTGKLTTVQHTLEKMRPKKVELKDYAYVNNFANPDNPIALEFPAGKAKAFKKDLKKTLAYLKKKIPATLGGERFLAKKKAIINELNRKHFEMTQNFEKKLRKEGFTLGHIDEEEVTRPEVMVLTKKGPVYISQIEKLALEGKYDEEKFVKLTQKYSSFQQELKDLIKLSIKITEASYEEIEKLEKNEVEKLIAATFEELKSKYDDKKIARYLTSVEETIKENLKFFKSTVELKGEDENDSEILPHHEFFRRFEVNIILDNSGNKKAPVVIETSPTYANLFGTIEKTNDTSGAWVSDFTRIKSGSLLKANGGFIIINAKDAFSEYAVWNNLKRLLLYNKLEIQDVYQSFNFVPSVLKPEPIKVDIKVIFIGNNYIYYLLSNYEDDFNKIFKVKVEFDYEMDRTETALLQYAKIIKKIIKTENLLPFDKTAVGKIIEYGARYAESKDKLTTRFAYVADLVREAYYWAKKGKMKIVTADYVTKAYRERYARHALTERKQKEMIERNDILIDVAGERTGQINGLAVYELNQISFGKPVRITAAVSIGNGSIINVERDAGLSGKTHNKAVLIIAGYFREKFGKTRPLSFNANIVFEQNYGTIDGDSASIAEIAAIISALAEVPINQQIAVTGSINQKGDVQPIGGVNEKIEGFFDVCKAKGLTGSQGVIIPEQNVSDLMLKDEVVNAVRKKKFHVYPVKRVEEALEILTGIVADEVSKTGKYKPTTLYGMVEKKLEEFRNAGKPKQTKTHAAKKETKTKKGNKK